MTFPEDHEYKPGAILIFPFGDGEGDSVSYFNGLFYGLLGHKKYRITGIHDSIGAFIVEVPEGDELKACEEYRVHERHVDWANLWDVTADNRAKDLEGIAQDVENLEGSAYLGGPAYDDGIRKLIERLEGLLPKSS